MFDDLGGGDPQIFVYPGVRTREDAPADSLPNGSYNDGDVVAALCDTTGRTVNSDPSVGEEVRSSNAWVKIHNPSGVDQYATAVYVEDPEQSLAELPDCKG